MRGAVGLIRHANPRGQADEPPTGRRRLPAGIALVDAYGHERGVMARLPRHHTHGLLRGLGRYVCKTCSGEFESRTVLRGRSLKGGTCPASRTAGGSTPSLSSGPVAKWQSGCLKSSRFEGSNPSRPTIHPDVAQLGRGGSLRGCPVRVRLPPSGPSGSGQTLVKAPRSDRGDFVGSNPTCPTNLRRGRPTGRILGCNPTDVGSNPSRATTQYGEQASRHGTRPAKASPVTRSSVRVRGSPPFSPTE